jgi:2-methylisocitrate lyase-like PEP mutase family enzyme
MNQIQRGIRFRELHTTDAIFLMPNAWDAGSALMLASLGFPAIATTSAGVAFSLGFPDQEAAVSRETMLERVGSIAAAIQLPVSADLQSGYGTTPEEVGSTIESAIRAGVVGANVEDHSGNPGQPLFSLEHAVLRIRGARRAADASGVPFVLTARTDAFLATVSEPFAVAVERCNAYREAGADCLFVPGASDPTPAGASAPSTRSCATTASSRWSNAIPSASVRCRPQGACSLARCIAQGAVRTSNVTPSRGCSMFRSQQSCLACSSNLA